MNPLSKDAVFDIIQSYDNDPQQLLAILLDIQAASGKNYIEKQWAELVSEVLKLPLSSIFDALTFYSMFSTSPRGKYLIEICQSAPCRFCNADKIISWAEAEAGIKMGQTSSDGKITLLYTNCVGACDKGPVIKIGDTVFGDLDEEKVRALVQCCQEGKLHEGNLKEAFPCQN